MPSRENIIRDFWMRFTEGRGALGGDVQFYEYAEDFLDEWKPRVREEVATFLRNYQPNFADFTASAMSLRVRVLDEKWMRRLLNVQVSIAFFEWLERRGLPRDVAVRARDVYHFDFDVRHKDRE